MVRTEDAAVNGTSWSSGWNDGMERKSVGAGQAFPGATEDRPSTPAWPSCPSPRIWPAYSGIVLVLRFPEILQNYTGYSDVALEFSLKIFLTIINS